MLYIAADHGGYQMKRYLTRYLKNQLKAAYKDLGAKSRNPNDDFVDFAVKVGKKVASKKGDFGILLCRNGQGVCIAANKIKGVRAAFGSGIENIEWARRDDHVNIVCLPAEYLSNEHAAAIVKKFLETPGDSDKRFERRLRKIAKLET